MRRISAYNNRIKFCWARVLFFFFQIAFFSVQFFFQFFFFVFSIKVDFFTIKKIVLLKICILFYFISFFFHILCCLNTFRILAFRVYFVDQLRRLCGIQAQWFKPYQYRHQYKLIGNVSVLNTWNELTNAENCVHCKRNSLW